MYSQEEISSAVAAGALSEDAADSLRAHVASLRERPVSDEEHFRLINSFNDIFVAIGVIIMLIAMAAIGQSIGGLFVHELPDFGSWDSQSPSFQAWLLQKRTADAIGILSSGLLVAATAWLLAEFFTRKRRMALPSILLLIAFIAGIFAAVVGVAGIIEARDGPDRLIVAVISLGGVAALAGAWLHWRRFAVPITIAAGAGSAAVAAIGLIVAAVGPEKIGDQETLVLALVFAAGLVIFAFAMRWDISDRERQTRRSDVAFWLHLLAAPMIAHPVFYALGVTEGNMVGVASAMGVIAVYFIFGMMALAIDRRALLVSALVYVLFALTWLFERFGAVELNFALTALIVGSALLTLSAFWTPIRHIIVGALPHNVQQKLPVSGIVAASG